MIEARETEIAGSLYRVTQLPASKGFRMLTQILKIVGPSLGALADASGGKLQSLGNLKVSSDSFSKAAEALCARLDTTQVEAMLRELCAATEVRPAGADKWMQLSSIWELHFAGKMGDLLRWFRFALEVQFGDFFTLLGEHVPLESNGGAEPRPVL